MNLEEAEKLIVAAIETARAKGYTIARRLSLVRPDPRRKVFSGGACCALGALIVARDCGNPTTIASWLLQWSPQEARAFMAGFDDYGGAGPHYELGRKLGERYVERKLSPLDLVPPLEVVTLKDLAKIYDAEDFVKIKGEP